MLFRSPQAAHFFFNSVSNLVRNLAISIFESSFAYPGPFFGRVTSAEDFELLHPDNTVICQVRTSRASMSLADATDDSSEGEEVSEEAEAGTSAESQESKSEESKEGAEE